MALQEFPAIFGKKPIETLEHVHKFIKDGLLISDPKSLPFADYYRLLQQPVFKFGRKKNKADHHRID